MNLTRKRKVTIIAEALIESHLIADIKALGAHGYTITEARGEGARGKRSGQWDDVQNIRIEIICEPEVADAIVENMVGRYYHNYAMILFVSEVEVVRREKF